MIQPFPLPFIAPRLAWGVLLIKNDSTELPSPLKGAALCTK